MTEGLSGMLSGLTQGGGGNLVQSVLKVAQSQSGGLGGLLSKFTSGGNPAVADKAQSWIGTGQNQQISGDEVEQTVGSDTVAAVAQDAGVSHDEAKQGLSAMLPQLVDKLSPNGQLPDLGSLSGGLGNLPGR
ncbi:MAG: YidB family protein [bacterium]